MLGVVPGINKPHAKNKASSFYSTLVSVRKILLLAGSIVGDKTKNGHTSLEVPMDNRGPITVHGLPKDQDASASFESQQIPVGNEGVSRGLHSQNSSPFPST
jgi:hypothetical protein